MKVYDCITYFDEKTLFEIRLNCLNKYVDKFIVAEAAYTHSGNIKKINFNINDYPLFKEKIHHIIIKKKPKNIYIIYDHFADQKELKKKWNNKIFLSTTSINKLPEYIRKNIKKYNNWIDK